MPAADFIRQSEWARDFGRVGGLRWAAGQSLANHVMLAGADEQVSCHHSLVGNCFRFLPGGRSIPSLRPVESELPSPWVFLGAAGVPVPANSEDCADLVILLVVVVPLRETMSAIGGRSLELGNMPDLDFEPLVKELGEHFPALLPL